MLEKILNSLKSNILLKIVSLFAAFIIWAVAVNISNPEISDSVNADITVENSDAFEQLNKMYKLDMNTVKISYKVRTTDASKISSSDFKVYVDIEDYSITGALPVYVEPSERIKSMVSSVSQSPIVVHVKTEDLMKKDFDIDVTWEGTPAEGYVATKGTAFPSRITVKGPVSVIGRISGIGITANVEGANSTINGKGNIIYYDANGNQIDISSDVIIPDNITYTLPIYKTKNLSVTAQTSGEPAKGYRLNAVVTDTDFITVYGEDEVLDSYKSVTIPASKLNINGAGSNVTVYVDLADYIPEGLYPISTNTEATIVAQISKTTDTAPQRIDFPEREVPTAPPSETQPAESIDSEEESSYLVIGNTNRLNDSEEPEDLEPEGKSESGNETETEKETNSLNETKSDETETEKNSEKADDVSKENSEAVTVSENETEDKASTDGV